MKDDIAQAQEALAIAQNNLTELLAKKGETITGEWLPCIKMPVVVHVRKQRKGEKEVRTREGIAQLLPDDLIMRGVAGEEYPISRELFYATYYLR